MKVIFSNRAFASILAETTEKIETETGGLFLGVVKDDIWYVVEAIDPGPKSVFEVAYFEYDKNYTQHLINKIANLYNLRLELIGLWHRHPGSFDQFSTTDDGTNYKYATMRKEGAISGLVNIDPTFRLTIYHVDKPCVYRRITYEVGDELIPKEMMEFKSFGRFTESMSLQQDKKSREYHMSTSLDAFMKLIENEMDAFETETIKANNIEKDECIDCLTDFLIDDLIFFSEKAGIEISILMQDGSIILCQQTIDGDTKLEFFISEKDEEVVFRYKDKDYYYYRGMFSELMEKSIRKNNEIKDNVDNAESTRRNVLLDSIIKIIKM